MAGVTLRQYNRENYTLSIKTGSWLTRTLISSTPAEAVLP
jgi:hypothetical protein